MYKLIKKVVLFFSISLCLLNMQCDDDIIVDDFPCEFSTVVNESEYANLVSDEFTFVEANIDLDCLFIKISASGCDGNSWQFNLVDSGAVAESSPEQRFLKFALENNELCLAVFERTVSFDLKPLQIENSNEIILNIEGLESSLNYKY